MQTRRKGQPCIDPRLYAFLEKRIFDRILNCNNSDSIGPLQDPVTWLKLTALIYIYLSASFELWHTSCAGYYAIYTHARFNTCY